MKENEEKFDYKTCLTSHSFYIEGLWVNGARWIAKDHSLDEAQYSY
jgi:hypothetical protein